MVAWVVIDRQHFRQTSPSFFPCSNSHFGTHPALIPEEIIPFFSCTYVEPILQPLCFHIHTCNGGVPPPQAANLPTCFRVIPFLSTFLRTLLHIEKSYPYSYQKLPHSLRKTPGGRGEGACGYGPGGSLTDWTGRIPDTVDKWLAPAGRGAYAVESDQCHGRKATIYSRI